MGQRAPYAQTFRRTLRYWDEVAPAVRERKTKPSRFESERLAQLGKTSLLFTRRNGQQSYPYPKVVQNAELLILTVHERPARHTPVDEMNAKGVERLYLESLLGQHLTHLLQVEGDPTRR